MRPQENRDASGRRSSLGWNSIWRPTRSSTALPNSSATRWTAHSPPDSRSRTPPDQVPPAGRTPRIRRFRAFRPLVRVFWSSAFRRSRSEDESYAAIRNREAAPAPRTAGPERAGAVNPLSSRGRPPSRSRIRRQAEESRRDRSGTLPVGGHRRIDTPPGLRRDVDVMVPESRRGRFAADCRRRGRLGIAEGGCGVAARPVASNDCRRLAGKQSVTLAEGLP